MRLAYTTTHAWHLLKRTDAGWQPVTPAEAVQAWQAIAHDARQHTPAQQYKLVCVRLPIPPRAQRSAYGP